MTGSGASAASGAGVDVGSGATVAVGFGVGEGSVVVAGTAVGFGVGEGPVAAAGTAVGTAAGVVGATTGVGEGCGVPLSQPTKTNTTKARVANTIRARGIKDKLGLSRCSVWDSAETTFYRTAD